MTNNELKMPNYIKNGKICKTKTVKITTIKNIPVAVLLELIFVCIPPEEIIHLSIVCHDWNHLLLHSCLTLEYFWRDMCLNTNGIPMLILNNIKRKKKERNRKRKKRLKKQIKRSFHTNEDSKSELSKLDPKKEKPKPVVENIIIEMIKSIYPTDNIIKEVCNRVFFSKNVLTKPSWRHHISAKRILYQRWRDIPNDTKEKTLYTTYHYTTPDIVGSWALMCEDRYLTYLTNGFINVIDVNTMKPPPSFSSDTCQQKADIPLSTIKLPVPTPNEYGWIMPLSSTSPWVVISFSSCIQMSNIITGQSFHNLNPRNTIQKDSCIKNSKTLAKQVIRRIGCVADGDTSQPVGFTYAKPTMEVWDLNTMTMIMPMPFPISTISDNWDLNRMAINDSHSLIAISNPYISSSIIDRRSNILVDHSTFSGELVWRDNYLFIAGPCDSHLFDIRRGLSSPLSSPLWSKGKPCTTTVGINNAGMIAYHDFNSNTTVLYDLFRYDEGMVRQWINPATNMSQIILRDDRLYLLGFNDAVVYDYAKYLPNIIHW